MSEGRNGKEHIYLYDWVRIIGTVLVVFGHSVYMEWSGDMGSIACSMENVAPNFVAWHTALGKVSNFAYIFHMPLFFALSGAVYAIGNKEENLGILAQKKVKRLLVPYYFGGLLWMFPLKCISGFYSDNVVLVKALVRFVTGQYAMGHLWFLAALFMCFILFYYIRNIGGGVFTNTHFMLYHILSIWKLNYG